jgi:MFS transporter, DHA2 family, glioxin efflux transporter
VVVVLLFTPPHHAKPAEAPLKEKLLQMDPLGAAIVMGFIVSFMLAMQYGGQTHGWNSGVVIGLLVTSAVLFVVFVLWEIYQKERAMVVARLVRKSESQEEKC